MPWRCSGIVASTRSSRASAGHSVTRSAKGRPTAIGRGSARQASCTGPPASRVPASGSGGQAAAGGTAPASSRPAAPRAPSWRARRSMAPNSASPFFQAMRSATVRRQVGQPLPRPVRMLDDVVPALGREGVGADHEAVGELQEGRAPGRVDLAHAWRGRCGRRGRTTGSCACAASRAPSRAHRNPNAPTGCARRGPAGTGARWHRRRSASAGTACARAPVARRAAPPAGRRRRRRRGIRRWPRSGSASAATRGASTIARRRASRCRSRRACGRGAATGSTRSGASAKSFCVPSSLLLETIAALEPGLAQQRHRLLRRQPLPGVVAVVQVGVEDRQRLLRRHRHGRARNGRQQRQPDGARRPRRPDSGDLHGRSCVRAPDGSHAAKPRRKTLTCSVKGLLNCRASPYNRFASTRSC